MLLCLATHAPLHFPLPLPLLPPPPPRSAMPLPALPMATSPIDGDEGGAGGEPPLPPPPPLTLDSAALCGELGARTVGDYVLMRTLGAGAVGRVKLARHIVTGALVAVKIVRKSLLRSHPALAVKVKREIAVLKLLGGAAGMEGGGEVGVLRLYDVYETGQCWLLVLEYCSGGDLFDKLMLGGYMAPGEVLAYFQQLVVALQFSHRHGITHRDLKLENVLIDRRGRLRLADFGMASMMRPGSLLETACGSPNYCAPEVLSGELYDGARSDCWSLGVILYAMLTGGLPFDDDNFSRLVAKVRSGIFFIPDEVHPDVAAIVRALLVVNPDARMSLDDVSRTPWFNSQPFPAHLAPLRSTVPRPLAATSASHDDPKGVSGGEGAGEDNNEEEDRDCSPIVEPVMPIVVHLTELGLGEIPTILRRLRSERRCVEKDFYKRIAAFVSQPGHSRSLEDELPLSPSTEGAGADSAQGDVLALLPGGVLPVSLADRPGTSADTGSLRSCADDAIRVR